MGVFIELILVLAYMNKEVMNESMMQIVENNKLIKENIQILAIVEKIRKKYNISLDEMDSITKEVFEELRSI